MKRYVKVGSRYVVADYDDMRDWRLEITEDTIKYRMEPTIEKKAQEIRLLMEKEGFDLINDEQYKRNPTMAIEHEVEGLRVLHFARKGKWRFMTREQITAEGP